MESFYFLRFARFLEDGGQFTNDEIDGYYIDNDDDEEEVEDEELQRNSIYPEDDDSIELEVTPAVAPTGLPILKSTFPTTSNSNGGISRMSSLQSPPHHDLLYNGGWISEDEKNESF